MTKDPDNSIIILEHLKAIREDQIGMKDDLAGVKGDIAGVKGDIAGMKGDMAGMKGDISVMQGDIATIKESVGKIDIRLHIVETHMSGFMSSARYLEREIDELRGRVEAIEEQSP